jgi:hypothetical protein
MASHRGPPAQPGRDCPSAKSLTFADYMRYLVTANIDADKQIYVRRAAWWCANDNRRTDNPMPLTHPEIANLRALLPQP